VEISKFEQWVHRSKPGGWGDLGLSEMNDVDATTNMGRDELDDLNIALLSIMD
jgi:hypothetical protein